MAKVLVAACGLAAAAIAVDAAAGPNWDAIHDAQTAKFRQHTRTRVLPLDHGPRAISTPWLNQLYLKESGGPAAAPAADHAAAP